MFATAGAGIAVRRMRRGERDAFAAHLSRLDADSRFRRFGRFMSDAAVTAYAAAEDERPGLLQGAFIDGVLRGVGELRPFGDPAEGRAEAAFSVEPGFQRRGIGDALFRRILLVARNDGVSRLTVLCLPENGAMQRLARRHGGALVSWPGEVTGTVTERHPTVVSLAREEAAEFTGRLASRWQWWFANNPFLRLGGTPVRDPA